MRRGAVLLSVLVIASSASATITSPMEIVETASDTFAINMPSGMSYAADVSGGYWAFIGTEECPLFGGVLDPPPPIEPPPPGYVFPCAGDTGIWEPGIGVWGVFETFSTSTTWTAPPGIYAHSFSSSGGTQENPLNLYTIADDFSAFYLVDTYVPEPATLLLLGLGAALLRKRR